MAVGKDVRAKIEVNMRMHNKVMRSERICHLLSSSSTSIKKLFVFCTLIIIELSCQNKSSDSVTTQNHDIDTLRDNSIVSAGTIKTATNVISDSLRWYLMNQKPMSKLFYKKIFKDDLTSIDTVFVYAIGTPVGFTNPVLTIFHSVESDRLKQLVDLSLFDSTWNLIGTISLKYEVDYYLYSQDYRFLNDSVIEIVADQGLGFDTDDYVKTTVKVRLDELRIFDTLEIKVDTIRVAYE